MILRAWIAGLLLAGGVSGRAADDPQSPDEPAPRPVSAVEVRVAPEKAGRIYELGEVATFKVTVTAGGRPLKDAAVTVRMGLENMPAEEKPAVVPAEGLDLTAGPLSEPGFIRCTVKAVVGGKTYAGTASAGFSPGKIKPTQVMPADFDAYWQTAREELARVPMDARVQLIPGESTGVINVYRVSFRNWSRTPSDRYPGRIYGILCEPKAPGRYPAVLRLPPAGVRSYRGERDLAQRGMITLEIGIHGIPLDQSAEIYDQLRTAALDGYASFNLDDPGRYYFRRVHLGCVRALDFLTTRKNWDGKNLVTFGASQGGMLAVAAGALEPRVTAVVALIPAYCDVTAYLFGRAGGWPHLFRNPDTKARSADKIATTGYYDTVNFARKLKVPVFVALGLNDENCPPTSVFAAYNVITSRKDLYVDPEATHEVGPEMNRRARTWLAAEAGLPR